MYTSTKTFTGLPCAHRQWRDEGHCRLVHGYDRTVIMTFGAHALDHKEWVVDFGGLKSRFGRFWTHFVKISILSRLEMSTTRNECWVNDTRADPNQKMKVVMLSHQRVSIRCIFEKTL